MSKSFKTAKQSIFKMLFDSDGNPRPVPGFPADGYYTRVHKTNPGATVSIKQMLIDEGYMKFDGQLYHPTQKGITRYKHGGFEQNIIQRIILFSHYNWLVIINILLSVTAIAISLIAINKSN